MMIMMGNMNLLVIVLSALVAVDAASQFAATPTPFAGSPTPVNHGRGARRAFIGRGGGARFRSTPSASVAPTSSPTFSTTARHTPTFPATPAFAPTFAPTFAPAFNTFPSSAFPQQRSAAVRAPTPAPTAFSVAPRRASPAVGFSPEAAGFNGKPKTTATPIVALNFNLRDDGSYITSSETGDGTVRQEQGQFNGATMAVQGMYAYRDRNGPVQVNYVADEFGFQPQGPNIHPAILQAVAEQVEAARSAKSRKGAKGLNGLIQDDEGFDYDDDNGAGTSPRPSKSSKTRTVRRVLVRRL